MVGARHGCGMGMAWQVNQTRRHCVNQMGKTYSKPLAARHGRGTAQARHAMCELALNPPSMLDFGISPHPRPSIWRTGHYRPGPKYVGFERGRFYSLVGFPTSVSSLRFYRYILKICYRNCGGYVTDAMGCRCSIRDGLLGRSWEQNVWE